MSLAKDDHQALYQSFDFQQGDVRLRGATVAGYCPVSERVFLLSYVTNPEIPDPEFAARLQEHLAALACHATD